MPNLGHDMQTIELIHLLQILLIFLFHVVVQNLYITPFVHKIGNLDELLFDFPTTMFTFLVKNVFKLYEVLFLVFLLIGKVVQMQVLIIDIGILVNILLLQAFHLYLDLMLSLVINYLQNMLHFFCLVLWLFFLDLEFGVITGDEVQMTLKIICFRKIL